MLHNDEKEFTDDLSDEKINAEFETAAKKVEEQAPKNNVTDTIDDGEEMELLADLKKPTDKDGINNGAQNNVSSESNSNDLIKTNGNVNKTIINYQNHELIAKLSIAALNVGMCLILQFIADDWSEEAEKKYKLSPTSKSELLEPLSLVLQQSKSKYNPVVILVITVLVSYVPMFISAFRSRKENIKAAKNKKKYLDKGGDDAEDLLDAKQKVAKEINDLGKVETSQKEKIIEVFKMTVGQTKRLKEIKAKKGRRSAADMQFLKEMNLEGLI